MKYQLIGNIPKDFGQDYYYLLTLEETDPVSDYHQGVAVDRGKSQDYVYSEFHERVYHNTHTPGQPFCHTVLVMPKSDTEFIGIAQVR